MTFREAVLSQSTPRQKKKIEAADAKDRRLLWSLAERVARRRIEKKTGEKLVGAVDWTKWLTLLKEIMPLILQLLAIFGV